MPRLVKFAETKDVPAGQARAFAVEGHTVAVFNTAGGWFALDDTCPHAGAPLCEGEVSGGKVTCPWHAADFDLRSGAALCPPATEGVRAFKVVVEGNDLQLEL